MARGTLALADARAIGQRLRGARLTRGLSQEQVAARVGRRQTQISALEHGQHITLRSLMALSPVLGMSVDAMLGLRDGGDGSAAA